MTTRTVLIALPALVLVFSVVGCKAPPVEPALDSDVAAQKVPALIEQVRQGDDADYEALVASLDDADPAVRLYAIRALEELTGQTHGYRYYQQSPDRRPAINRWKDWLAQRDAGNGFKPGRNDTTPTTDLADGSPDEQAVPGVSP